MTARKRIPISNQYMFNKVMSNEDICKGFLECVLGFEVGKLIYINSEQTLEPHLGSKGVRLDVFAKDGSRVYDIEMQTVSRESLGHRFRYYQGAMDITSLDKGQDFDELADAIILFVCQFDPFGEDDVIYEIKPYTQKGRPIDTGITWIALNCKAYEKAKDTSLRSLLKYIFVGTIDDTNKLVASKCDRFWKCFGSIKREGVHMNSFPTVFIPRAHHVLPRHDGVSDLSR